MEEIFLVTGATGRSGAGGAAADELLRAGRRVRVFVREAAKLRPDLRARVEVVEGNFDAHGPLERAVENVTKMFLISNEHPQQVEREVRAVEAAARAGVRHVVKVSALEARVDHELEICRHHGHIEERLRAVGMPFTSLRLHYFMQNVHLYAATLLHDGVMYVPAGDAPVGMIDGRDFGAAGARAMLEPGHEGKVYDLSGPEALTFHRVADVLSDVLGRPVRYVDVSREVAVEHMRRLGISEWHAHSIVDDYHAYQRGFGGVTDDARRLLGRPPVTFREFAESFFAAREAPRPKAHGPSARDVT